MGDKKYNFQTLTPVSDVKLNIYSDALNFAMKTPSIKNIAISGSYGAGKSSVLATYKKQNTDASFLHISLAHFNPVDTSEDNSSNGQKSIPDSVIEGKILNQLIHQTDSAKIPQTDFKTKANISLKKQRQLTGATVVVILSILHMCLFGTWANLVNSLSLSFVKAILDWTAHYDSLLISGGLCVAALAFIVFNMIKTQKHKKTLKKISFQGNDIEIFSDDANSFFDKHLNETLYLFENCGADNIVFEDMDRYNSNHIFEKLREMNTLINNRNPEREVPLRFMYLLRDDIFDSKDRTKFFDYIIPIVPVIDGSNSINKFLAVFKDAGIANQFTEAFLNDLSLYIDDMRILKNVCNEYIIYSEQLSEIEIKEDKLLAILVYKNLFPKDFNALQLRRGYVYNLFEQRKSLSESAIAALQEKIKRIENLLDAAKKETLNSIDELDALFLLPSNILITGVNGKRPPDSSRTDLIRYMKETPGNVSYNYSNGSASFTLDSKILEFEKDPIYTARKETIEAKEKEKSESLKRELQSLQRRILVLQNQQLKDVIDSKIKSEKEIFAISYKNSYLDNDVEIFEDVKDSPYFSLIIYLVRNGYIDETYTDYMTYFYNESITANDKNFLLSVADHKKKAYGYILNDPTRVLSRLQPISFSHEETLNHNLIDRILAEERLHAEHLAILVKQLEEAPNFDFIAAQWEQGKEKPAFIQVLNHYWPEAFHSILNKSVFTDEQKHQYAVDMLYYCPDADIKKANSDKSLSDYVSNNPAFLNIPKSNADTIIRKLELLGVCFKSIDYSASDKTLFDEVYKRKMYLFTPDNVVSMLRDVRGVEGSDTEIIQQSLTLLREKPNDPLYLYVAENLEEYLSSILSLCDGKITDSEETAIYILNSDDVSDMEIKASYISFLKTPIEEISSITNKALWRPLLQSQTTHTSEKNILDYFFLSGNGLDDTLIHFLNEQLPVPCNFTHSEIDKDYGEGSATKFLNEIVKCNGIKDERYKAILASIGLRYSTFEVPNIEDVKISILIDLSIIPMTEGTLVFMRKTYEDEIIHYIIHNIEAYTADVIDEECFEDDEILSLLHEPISDAHKIRLLPFLTAPISVSDKNFTGAVMLHILENNYDSEDIAFLVSSFETFSESIQLEIVKKCTEGIEAVIDIAEPLAPELYDTLLVSSEIDIEKKLDLFAIQIKSLTIDEIKKSLGAMKLEEYLGLFDGKQAVLAGNTQAEEVLGILSARGLDFNSTNQDDGTLRVYGKKKFGEAEANEK